MENLYKILGVDNNATEEEIKEAFDSKIFKTEKIKQAYEVLSVPTARKKYDKILEEKREKNYYEILGVKRNATQQEIIIAYHNLKENKKNMTPEKLQLIEKSYKTLFNPTRRSRYNISIGMKSLKHEESKKFKVIVKEVLRSKYDNYSREIYIKKYENKIEFLNKQIEMLRSEKNQNSLSYRVRLSSLVSQLEQAMTELDKWTNGRQNVVATKIIKKKDTVIYKQVNGKGEKTSFVSKILSKSIENIDENEKELQRDDISTLQHIKLNIKNGFWKNVKKFSSGTIKLYATTWSKVQDIVIHKPNFITALKETEEEIEERLTKLVR